MNISVDISKTLLKTKRLMLRPWQMRDVNDLYAYASLDGVGQKAGWLPHRNYEDSKYCVEHYIADRNVLALVKDHHVIGHLGINQYPEKRYPALAKLKGCELGFTLAKDYWGQGLMPEAVKCVIDYLFQQIDVDFIMCTCFKSNPQSLSVIKKCGFKYLNSYPFKTRCNTNEIALAHILFNPKLKENA